MDAGAWSELLGGAALPSHVYLHVPFCRSKCAYCDFASVADASPRLTIAVFRALEAEIRRWRATSLPGIVETVYVGGGTPSLYADHVARLLRRVTTELPVRDGAEITVEANPDSADEAGLRAMASAGANRISMGVQTLNDAELAILGRVHSAAQAREAIRSATEVFAEVSVDLICGIPGQTLDSWLSTVAEIARSGVRHVSVYPLTVEQGTPLAELVTEGRVREPDPDAAGEMMLAAEGLLEKTGLARYEVASYARPGSECRHNLGYWTGRQYAGVGPGAHSMYNVATARTIGATPGLENGSLDESSRVRTWCARSPDEWLAGEGYGYEVLTPGEVAREDVMLALRLARGVSAADVANAGLAPVLESLARDGLVVLEGTSRNARWHTTTRGWLLGNEVFARVWNAEDDACEGSSG